MTNKINPVVIFIVGAFVISSLILFSLSGYYAWDSKKFLDGASPVTGETVSVESYQSTCGKDRRPCTKYRSIVKFQTANGEAKQEVLEGNYEGQKELELLYNANSSPSLRLKGNSLWIKPLILGAIGLFELFIVLPFILFVAKRKRVTK